MNASFIRLARRAVTLLAFVAALAGCAGVHEYTTGVPARDSERFYASLTAAAEERGNRPYTPANGGMTVDCGDNGSLMYSVEKGAIVVRTYPSQSGTDAEIQARAKALREEHLAMMEAARAQADANRAFSY
ncbi:MAG: hypothetical protein H6745_21090 [Deltaproteobacteria bacterium]|nr:hypothetical protein [Deltaproteobacteria bacterium]